MGIANPGNCKPWELQTLGIANPGNCKPWELHFSQGPNCYIYSKEGEGGGVFRGGGGFEKRSSGKPLKFTLLHVSICSMLVRNFSNTLGFVSLCRYDSLLNYDIFIQPGTPN